ncbi:hypothetical protein OSH08_07720 [Kaistia geumhonensis]|uniref:Uncharacterized protein n=1 Tax=Kaistia geumhonensis TaxID=410839 RepID=A0ABU0M4K8_9HYPH|nr:hypothetical protein [Kaistia geumhonensis]MCX5478887.1 hypothetical protein [Kaistia geumhonensis]MDQ0515894.1 hypothetical protein [Kaistia geumhonensis]
MAAPKKSERYPRVPSDATSDAERDHRLHEVALRRKASFGMLKGSVSLSLEEALAPLDENEIKAWGL